MTVVLRVVIVKYMKKNFVTLSSKYQLVIPKVARQTLGLDKPRGQRFMVKHVSDNEIVFRKDKSLDEFLGKYGKAFPADATAKLRQAREAEWDD